MEPNGILQTASRMGPNEILQMASSAAVAVSALAVALLGFLGLNTWRRKSKSEAAQKLGGLARKVASEIQETRTLVTHGGEAFDRERKEGESEAGRIIRDERYARMKRMETPRNTLRQLIEYGWEVEALLRIDLQSYIDPISNQLNGIRDAINVLFSTDSAGHPVKLSHNHDDEMMKVSGRGSRNDTVTPALEEAIDELKRRLKRFI